MTWATWWQRMQTGPATVVCGLLLPAGVSAVLVPLRSAFPNTDAALVLVAVIVAVAARGNRVAGLAAAASSALWFDFFLTQPYYRLSITGRGDVETTLLLLGIGAAVTELAVRGRISRATAQRRAEFLRDIGAAAAAASAGSAKADPSRRVGAELANLLGLETITYQRGTAGLGAVARLQPDGLVSTGRGKVTLDHLPVGAPTELLVMNGGMLLGRFLMTPRPESHPDRERRLVAVTLADQLGAQLAS